MKVRFTRRAFADREAILDYLTERSPAGARKVFVRLRSAIGQLADQPMSGVETDRHGVRALFVGRYPYKVFYRIRGDEIEVLHIRHTSQNAPDLS